MNRGELIVLMQDIINFNPAQTNQDFTSAQLVSALNRAYRREVGMARQEGNREYFKVEQSFTWPANQQDFNLKTVSPSFAGRPLIRALDTTSNTEPGGYLSASKDGISGTLRWLNKHTLRWGTNGPTQDTTIRMEYFALPPELLDDEDEPDFVIEEWQELLAWSAAGQLRGMSDEMTPVFIRENLRELRAGYWKDISRGRLMDDVPWIFPSEQNSVTSIPIN